MRSKQLRTLSSQRRQTALSLAAVVLGCGFAAPPTLAQSMGSFGRRSGAGSFGGAPQQADPQREAPQSQPAQAPPVRVSPPQSYIPVRAAPPAYMPVRVAPPATAGGGFGQSYGSANSQVPGYDGRHSGALLPPGFSSANPPARSGAIFGSNGPARGGESGVTINNANGGGQGDFRSGISRREGAGVGTIRAGVSGQADTGAVRGSSIWNPRPTGAPSREIRPGIGNVYTEQQPIRVTTPQGQRDLYRDRGYDGDRYVYGGGTTIVTNGPVLLGGYYYGNYCDYGYGQNVYPSIYTVYGGFPQYICNPSVIVVSQPYYPVYTTSYLPFYQPAYQVTYNETNYYVTSEERASEIRQGGDTAREAVKSAYKEGSYQAAFADIAKAWKSGNIAPLHKHLRDDETKVSILLKKKYAYSIASSDFEQITRDALDRLSTVSFKFTRLRKAKNGDVTAYGKHVYRVSDDSSTSNASPDGGTVPFDGADQPYDQSADPAPGDDKVVYVAYTLRHRDNLWYIIAVNSSPNPLVAGDEDSDTSAQ